MNPLAVELTLEELTVIMDSLGRTMPEAQPADRATYASLLDKLGRPLLDMTIEILNAHQPAN